MNIAFANEVALACERMGVNVFAVRELINARPDRHMHLPGAGVGGHCLPKDGWLLKHGVETYSGGGGEQRSRGAGASSLRLIPLAREINDGMPGHMATLIAEALAEADQPLAGSKVVLLGAAYLENSDDTRNTPAAALAKNLLARGAEVMAHDPYVRGPDWQHELKAQGPNAKAQLVVPLTDDLWAALEGADCAALVTRHREYLALDLARMRDVMRTPVLVDGRGVFPAAACGQVGVIYRGVGKASYAKSEG